MIKTELWQILEIVIITSSLFQTFSKRGTPIVNKEKWDKFNNYPENIKDSANLFVFCIALLIGPILAYLGGCTGMWLLIFTAFSMGIYFYSVHIMETGKARYINFSPVRSIVLFGAQNYILYLGGFWTVIS